MDEAKLNISGVVAAQKFKDIREITDYMNSRIGREITVSVDVTRWMQVSRVKGNSKEFVGNESAITGVTLDNLNVSVDNISSVMDSNSL